MVGTTKADLITGIKLLKRAFIEPKSVSPEKVMKEILEAAQKARKESILALEAQVDSFSHPFMCAAFRFVVDGFDSKAIRELFENKIYLEEEHLTAGAKVFVDAGGFAPTIGIIGAVLGLIHVMENLSDTSKLGAGIAVAFVATVYGVGAANIFLLPLGNKLKRKIKIDAAVKEMILTGAIGIVEGLNPIIIKEQLTAYIHDHGGKHEEEAGEEAAPPANG